MANYRKEYFPDVKSIRNKKIEDINSTSNPEPKEEIIRKKEIVQTNFTVPENVTPEWLVQQFLNEIAKRLPTFKDGNLVQGLNAVARLINDKELEVVDVENTMRKFVSNDKLKEKVNNARYD